MLKYNTAILLHRGFLGSAGRRDAEMPEVFHKRDVYKRQKLYKRDEFYFHPFRLSINLKFNFFAAYSRIFAFLRQLLRASRL